MNAVNQRRIPIRPLFYPMYPIAAVCALSGSMIQPQISQDSSPVPRRPENFLLTILPAPEQ
jgi:hypothetical protein